MGVAAAGGARWGRTGPSRDACPGRRSTRLALIDEVYLARALLCGKVSGRIQDSCNKL